MLLSEMLQLGETAEFEVWRIEPSGAKWPAQCVARCRTLEAASAWTERPIMDGHDWQIVLVETKRQIFHPIG